jgi:hypothetical protein
MVIPPGEIPLSNSPGAAETIKVAASANEAPTAWGGERGRGKGKGKRKEKGRGEREGREEGGKMVLPEGMRKGEGEGRKGRGGREGRREKREISLLSEVQEKNQNFQEAAQVFFFLNFPTKTKILRLTLNFRLKEKFTKFRLNFFWLLSPYITNKLY